MPKIVARLLLVLACTFAAGFLPSSGQTAAATNTPSTNAPAATPPVIPLGDVVAQAQATIAQLQKDKAGLDPDPTLNSVSGLIPDLKSQIDDRTAEDRRMLEVATSLSGLQAAQTEWQSLSNSLATAQSDLSERVDYLDTMLGKLDAMDAQWQATLATATKPGVPPDMAQTIKAVRTQIADNAKSVNAHLTPLYAMQNQVAAQDRLAQAGLDTVKKAIDAGWAELFERNNPPLWDAASFARPPAGLLGQEENSLGAQISRLRTYLSLKIGALLLHALLLVLLIMAFYWFRNAIHARAKEEPVLQEAAQIFNLPLATALLLALLVSGFLYPGMPRLFGALIGAIALIPAVIVTRRLIDATNFPILYATIIAYFVDLVRYVATPASVLSRLIFIGELMAVLIFILTVFRSRHLSDTDGAPSRLKRLTRVYLHLTFLVLVFAGFANVFGYIPLSNQAGNGMLESSYLAVMLYAAVRIADAMVISWLCLDPISHRLGMVRRHRDLIYQKITTVIRWAMFAVWLVAALKLFTLYEPLVENGGELLAYNHKWGSLEYNFGSLLAFPLTIWAAFLISRLIRFFMEEEIYPHLQLGRGVPYAVSTVVHYLILLLGFFLAVKAGGADLTQFSFLAGAFGVGLGFGLQNIFNNFISGIILLFERPIKVGDDIQIDATTVGRVERIGIRASVILLANGSELIVPNGNLISNPVTNWTLSNCERLIEIPVTVTSKVEPQQVLDLLTKVVRAHSHVLKNPAPQAVLVTLGASLGFRVRAWIDSEEEWMKITSELSLAILAALAKENITIG